LVVAGWTGKRRERKKRKRMQVSGRQVIKLQKLMARRKVKLKPQFPLPNFLIND